MIRLNSVKKAGKWPTSACGLLGSGHDGNEQDVRVVISLKTEMINVDDTTASHMRNEGARRRALDVVADDGVNQIGVQ